MTKLLNSSGVYFHFAFQNVFQLQQCCSLCHLGERAMVVL